MMYLLCYAVVMCLLVFLRERGQRVTSERFLVSDRRVGGVVGAMSIAASWIWAPAIFVSTRVGYEWGYSGLIWFVLPNMLALIIFAPLAAKVRKQLPEGYSYIESQREKGGHFWHAQLVVQLVMQVVIFAIQLTAGAELLHVITGADYSILVLGMALTPLLYSSFSGLRTSVFTDAIQYVVIASATLLLISFFPSVPRVWDVRSFQPFDGKLLMEFGLSSGIGLVVAIFADHQQWQRAFATGPNKVLPSYFLGSVFHGLVTCLLGSLGCWIAQVHFQGSGRLELIGVEFVQGHYPAVFSVVFVVMAMCALISTLDSGLCAFSSLVMTELKKDRVLLNRGRYAMVLLVAFGSGIALFRPSLLTLWFLAGTIRLSSFAPTVASVIWPNFPGKAGTLAIIFGIAIGGPIFAYGSFLGDAEIRTIGMLASIGCSLLVMCIVSWCRQRNSQKSQIWNRHCESIC